MHPRHMTDTELGEAYNQIIFPEDPDNLFEEQVVEEFVYRFNLIKENN
jgi:hypothetical protein